MPARTFWLSNRPGPTEFFGSRHDPLVLRLRANPQYSAPVVAPDAAAAMHGLIVGMPPNCVPPQRGSRLLKLERRRQRIRTGNAQELYFPVCFELAVTKGAPTPQDRDTAAAVLTDVHRGRDRTAIEVLHEYVASPDVVAMLSAQLDRSWRDVRASETTPATVAPFLAELGTVLGPATSHRARGGAPTGLVRRDRRRDAVQPGRPGPHRIERNCHGRSSSSG